MVGQTSTSDPVDANSRPKTRRKIVDAAVALPDETG
jgi:hypothetical protein